MSKPYDKIRLTLPRRLRGFRKHVDEMDDKEFRFFWSVGGPRICDEAAEEIDRLSSESREKDLCLEACRYKLEKLFDATGGIYHGGMEHSQLIKLINSVSGNQK